MAKKSNQSLATRDSGLSRKKKDTTPAPIPASGLEISLVLMINGEEIILTGDSTKDGLKVEYHRSWKEAVTLGTFMDGLAALGKAIGNPHLKEDFQEFIDKNLKPLHLDGIVEELANAQLMLTDLVINTTGDQEDATGKKNVYQLGLGFKFPGSVVVSDLSLRAFLIKYTYLTDHA